MRSNDPGRLSSCLGTRYQAVSHLLPIARRVSPCLLGRGSTRRARTVSPYRHRAPRQRAYDFLPARPPSPRFRTGETVSMLPTDDCFPTLVGEHSRLVRFRVTRVTWTTWRFTTSGTLRRAGGGARGVFVPLIRYRKSHAHDDRASDASVATPDSRRAAFVFAVTRRVRDRRDRFRRRLVKDDDCPDPRRLPSFGDPALVPPKPRFRDGRVARSLTDPTTLPPWSGGATPVRSPRALSRGLAAG